MSRTDSDNIIRFVVEGELDGINVKNFLRRYCGVSSRLLAKMKRIENGITSNGEHIRSIDILHSGDIVEIKMPEDENDIEPVYQPVEIVYEDDETVVFNKPPFMPVHPVREHQLDTLANYAVYHARSRGENYSFRAVNRLDRDTSGLVLTAKSSFSMTYLRSHVCKVYVALCEGELHGSGTVNAPIRLKEGHTIQREVGEGGVRAVTHYRAIKTMYGHTYVEFRLETGRTHQIRVHMSSIGHSLAGDDMYGGSREYFERQCLHCTEIEFMHPVTHKLITIRKDPDDWFGQLAIKKRNV